MRAGGYLLCSAYSAHWELATGLSCQLPPSARLVRPRRPGMAVGSHFRTPAARCSGLPLPRIGDTVWIGMVPFCTTFATETKTPTASPSLRRYKTRRAPIYAREQDALGLIAEGAVISSPIMLGRTSILTSHSSARRRLRPRHRFRRPPTPPRRRQSRAPACC